MKIAVSGKGGVGKTTFSAVLARLLSSLGKKVFAIDADPDANLASAVGVPGEKKIVPLAEMRGLIRERTEAGPGGYGVFFKLNPTVSDIPDKFYTEHGGVKVLVLGAVQIGGGGCACPENVFLKALLNHLVLQRDEVVIVDMEAGIEHFGRGVETSIDAVLAVVEPSLESIGLAAKIHELATQAGAQFAGAVLNKVQSPAVERRLRDELEARQLRVLGLVHYHQALADAGLAGLSLTEMDSMEDVVHLVDALGTFES